MKIRAGYQISYDCPQPTPMILQLSVHPSRVADLENPDRIRLDPPLPANTYHDSFGNFCQCPRRSGPPPPCRRLRGARRGARTSSRRRRGGMPSKASRSTF
jgi:hypothetical protein